MDLHRGLQLEQTLPAPSCNVSERIEASPQPNPYRTVAINGFMALGKKHCDHDSSHVEQGSELDPAHLHRAEGSTFSDAKLGVHDLEDRDRTMDLFPVGNPLEDRNVTVNESQVDLGRWRVVHRGLEDRNVTMDESQLDLELRLGVLGVLRPEGCRNMTTLTDEFRVQPVRQVDEEVDEEVQSRQAPLLQRQPRPVLTAPATQGITYHNGNKKWDAYVYDPKRQRGKRKVELGFYNTADEAKRVHDMAALKLDVRGGEGEKPYPLNFPESDYADYMRQYSDWSARDFIWKLRRDFSKFTKGKGSMKGVFASTKRDFRKRGRSSDVPRSVTYLMQVTWVDSQKRSHQDWRGGFTSEDEAGRFYDKASLAIRGDKAITNFRPSSYTAADIEEGRQWLEWKHPNCFAPAPTPTP